MAKAASRYDEGETSNKKKRCVSRYWEVAFVREHKTFQEKQSIKLIRGVAKIRQAPGNVRETVKFHKDSAGGQAHQD